MDDHYPASTSRIDLGELTRIGFVALQLVLLTAVAAAYELEGSSFIKLMQLATAGFIVHALAPERLRMPIFGALSMFAVVWILGPRPGLAVLGLGAGLIVLCNLPVRLPLKAALLAVAGLVLAYLRMAMDVDWYRAVWPVLASMFMFRAIAYVYDTTHGVQRAGFWQSMSYFFMLPNVCFPLFPVVDYKRFVRNYFNEDRFVVYQRGVKWVFRGLVHLVLYRVVYHYFAMAPSDVSGLADVLQFSLGAFLLYLQVSGQFHVIIGMMLLFGFNLPETHHLYYLSSSFTDFWRRINIYWKDFVMKLIYYPVHFSLKRYGATFALVGATAAVFLGTWLLHAYQWFWLRGTPLLEWHDALFWGVLAVLVVINSIWETRYGRARSISGSHRNPAQMAATALSTLATFTSICLLWGLWSSESLEQWVGMWRSTGSAWIGFLLLVPALFAASGLLARLGRRQAESSPARRRRKAPPATWRSGAVTSAAAAGALVLAVLVNDGMLPADAEARLSRITSVSLNQEDMERREIGYYENLTHGRHNSALWQVYNERPADWDWGSVEGGKVPTDDLRMGVIGPNIDTVFKGAALTTNAWGMRDIERQPDKPEDVYRVALIGASHLFGSGVRDEETFARLVDLGLESHQVDGRQVEVLNFGYPGGDAIRHTVHLEKLVLDFEPDALIYVAHTREALRARRMLAQAISRQMPIDYPDLAALVDSTGVDAGMDEDTIAERLEPIEAELMTWSYRRIAAQADNHGFGLYWLFLPRTHERLSLADIREDVELAESGGFRTISLHDVYDGHDHEDLNIAPWDDHPNKKAHELLARGILARLIQPDGTLLFASPQVGWR